MENKFEIVNRELNQRIESVLREWLPNGKVVGNDYCIGNISGDSGDSLKIDLKTGKWFDFASSEDKGGDLISLYSKMHGLKPGAAADALAERYSIEIKTYRPMSKNKYQTTPPEGVTVKPKFPPNSTVYEYKNTSGGIIFYTARFMLKGEKTYRPFTYYFDGNSENINNGEWKRFALKKDRPIYGLEHFTEENKDKPVLIVEGEKAADYARKTFIEGEYLVVTWSGGASAVGKTKWSWLAGRNVLIWPDADQAGVDAADAIVEKISHYCETIKVINVSDIETKGWDAADAKFKTFNEFKEWVFSRLELIDKDKETPAQIERKKKETQALRNIRKELNLLSNENGKIMANEAQAVRILENHQKFDGRVYFDIIKRNSFLVNDNGDDEELEDHIVTGIATFIQDRLKIEKMSRSSVRKAFEYVAMKNKRNTRKEWLESLKWDGINRIEESMIVYFNAKSEGSEEYYKYLQAAGRNFWISLAAMGIKPGSKVDFMLVLEGEQGVKKSTALRIIAGDRYIKPSCSIRNQEAFISSIEGYSIVEMAELDSYRGADINRLKDIVTTEDDNVKKLYKDAKKNPRTFVFVATTNESEYLTDPTGNRRFIPIEVGVINTEYIKRDLDQLYAEAVHRYKAGELWWEFPLYAEAIQDSKFDEDPWTPVVYEFLNRQHVRDKGYVRISEILSDKLNTRDNSGGIPLYTKEITRSKQMRVSSILKFLGWSGKIERPKGKGYVEKRYRPKGHNK